MNSGGFDEDDENLGPSASPSILLPSLSDVLACQFSVWYPHFSALADRYQGRRNVTIKSVIISPLPHDFVDYLNSDRLILPRGTRTSSALLEAASQRRRNDLNFPEEWSSDDEDETNKDHNAIGESKDFGADEDAPEALHEPSNVSSDDSDDEVSFAFPELNRQIDTAIRTQLGGACLPKFNWSAPKDAVWVNQGTMECRFAGDVYLLLKASDFCAHDLHHATVDVVHDGNNSGCVATSQPFFSDQRCIVEPGSSLSDLDSVTPTDPLTASDSLSPFRLQLVLRKWCTLYPSQEFRCFARNRKLLAISQRHHSQQYPHLVDHAETVQHLIEDFSTNVMSNVLSSNALPLELQNLSNYVFDVYIDKKQRVWLLDINVWASRTDPLLFEWSELVSTIPDQQTVVMRLVETEKQVRADPLSSYRAPIDTLHVATGGDGAGTDSGLASSTFFSEFMSQCERPT